MKLIATFLLVICFILSFSQSQYPNREIRIVKLSGRGYNLGLEHGKLLKKEIGEIVLRMKKNTADNLHQDADQVIREFNVYARFDETIKKYTPELFEEVKGIADGSGQALGDIMVLNLIDEFWVYNDMRDHHHCSGMGVPSMGGNAAYIAQNLDIESYTEGYQILLRLARSGKSPEQLILTHPGCIAMNGLNETGIGTCVNTLMDLKASSTGLPVAFIVRRIINSVDKNDLLEFIQTVPHASGQNYIIGIHAEVFDFEASANKVIRFNPNHANGSVYHTNHAIANDDIKPWYKLLDANQHMNANTMIRLNAVKKRIATASSIDDILIKETLRSKDDKNNPVCRTFDVKHGGFTFGSVIMTLTGKPFIQITAGSPDASEYKKIDFTDHLDN